MLKMPLRRSNTVQSAYGFIQGVPLATEPGNEDIATKFEQEYVRCVRNEEECVCSAPNCCDTDQRSASNILIGGKIIKEMSGSVASGTHCILRNFNATMFYLILTITSIAFSISVWWLSEFVT